MKRDKTQRLEPVIVRGNVLAIPLDNSDWALGSVIRPGTTFYVGFSVERFQEPLMAEALVGKDLKIFSWTNDAEVFRGNWRIIGAIEPTKDIELPDYRVFVDGSEMVESFDRKSLRPFDPKRDFRLGFRKIRSPLLVQDAVQAAFGIRDWKVGFQDMLLKSR